MTAQAGYKARALKQLMDAGLDVPEGFVVAAETFSEFVTFAGIKGEIDGLLASLTVRDKELLHAAGKRIQELILQSPFPEHVIKAIRDQYEEMALGSDVKRAGSAVLDLIKAGSQIFVSVRPSPAQWAAETAFPTELNVFGVQQIVEAVRHIWAAAFVPDHLMNKKTTFAIPSILIQKMVSAEKSGFLFTSHPMGKEHLLVESSWGLGEWNGLLKPDQFELDATTELTVTKKINKKPWMKKHDAATSRILRFNLPDEMAKLPSLDEREAKEFAGLSRRLPSQSCVEWVMERRKVYFLNVKPLHLQRGETALMETGEELLEGKQLAGITACGTLKLLSSSSFPNIEKGDIVLAKALMPELAPFVERAGGVVVEEGNHASFGAFFCREHDIPFLVADRATARLQDGAEVIIQNNTVYQKPVAPVQSPPVLAVRPFIRTIDAKIPAGLVRPEACFTYGAAPLKEIREQYEQTKTMFKARLAELTAGQTQTLWYVLCDYRSDELRALHGGQEEPQEANPALGLRGVKRILAQPEVYRFERDLITELNLNIGVLLSYVSTVDEVKQFKLFHPPQIPLGLLVSTPAAALALADLLQEGISHVCIDMDSLAQLVLGVDRNNPAVSGLFNPLHPTVVQMVRQATAACLQHGVEVSLFSSVPHPEVELADAGLSTIFVEEPAVPSAPVISQ